MISIDDQPISATFFGEGRWLTDFVTPESLDIVKLHEKLAKGTSSMEDNIVRCWDWVASEIKYVKFVKGKVDIEGHTSYQDDLWNLPAVTAKIGVGNCANKSFLLSSLLRRELASDKVYCVLGNLYNGKVGGHAWVQARLGGIDYILESTRSDVSMVPVALADRYEAVHLFNDERIYAIEGKTVLEPFTSCYSTWLRDYLNWNYIKGNG